MVMDLEAPALSFTVMVAVPAPRACVGEPEITPAVLIEMPEGRPVAEKVKGVVPPETPLVTFLELIATPTVEAGILKVDEAVKASAEETVP